MRKSNIWLACGLLSAFGAWQLSAIAQQPDVKSRPGAASQDDLSDQIQDLTEQTSKLLELTAQLDANADSGDGDTSSKEIRRTRERVVNQLKSLEKQVQRLKADKGRSNAEKQRADAESNRAEAAKKHAEAAEKHVVEIRRRAIEDARKAIPHGDVQFTGPGQRFAGRDVRELVKGLPGDKFILRSEVHGPHQVSPEDRKRLDEFRELVNQYRNEKDGDRKLELRNNIREKLSEQIDHDIESRKKQLSDLEAKVQRLQSQLEKSEGSKDEAIDSLLRILDGDDDNRPLSPEWMDVLSANGGPRGPWNENFNNDWNFQNGPRPVITTFRENHGPDQAHELQNAVDVVIASEFPIEQAITVPIAPLAPPVPVDPVEGVAPVAPVPPDEPSEPATEIEEDIDVHVEAIP